MRYVDLLLGKYPSIFSLRRAGPMAGSMCFGIETGDGWFDLLDRLCWRLNALRKLLRVDVKASQVKEKFGGLRFYVYPRMPRWMPRRLARWTGTLVYWLIDRAESESYRTCESCGKSGVPMARHYWYITSCEACAPEGYEHVRGEDGA